MAILMEEGTEVHPAEEVVKVDMVLMVLMAL